MTGLSGLIGIAQASTTVQGPQRFMEALGYQWPSLRVPQVLAYGVAYCSEVAHYLGGPRPTLTRRGVRSVCRDASFRIDKARAHLGYEPRTTAANGLPKLMPELRAIHDRMKALS